jgi:hypothetical protein
MRNTADYSATLPTHFALDRQVQKALLQAERVILDIGRIELSPWAGRIVIEDTERRRLNNLVRHLSTEQVVKILGYANSLT